MNVRTAAPIEAIQNEKDHAIAIDQLIALNQAPDAENNLDEIHALGEAIEAYEASLGHDNEPQTLRGILEVEMFKRRMKQRAMAEFLGVHETRFSEFLRGKREINIDFARKLYQKLQIPASVLLTVSK
jgi:HTH-type transcriptional regulator/antitoxin HigA